VFSRAFLRKKKWTEYELSGLFARERFGTKVILPIWHNINRDDLLEYSPAFADRLAKVLSSDNYGDIVESLLQVLGTPLSSGGISKLAESEIQDSIHPGSEWISPLSELTMTEEVCLLCSEPGDLDEGVIAFARTRPRILDGLAMPAAAIAQLTIARRLRLRIETGISDHPGATSSVWLEVVDRTPLGEPILDCALDVLIRLILESQHVNLASPAILSLVLHKNRKDVAISHLVQRGLLSEEKRKGFIFSKLTRHVLGISQRDDLRVRFSAAVTAGRLPTYVAVLFVLARMCSSPKSLFTEGVNDFQVEGIDKTARQDELANVIRTMVLNASSITNYGTDNTAS
jgi:hypothetical protein